MKTTQNWIPEILYEEDPNGLTGQLPFISVPKNEVMPNLLFIFESRETGDFEPGPDGEDSPVFDIDLHQYVNMRLLQKELEPSVLASIRTALKLPNKNA